MHLNSIFRVSYMQTSCICTMCKSLTAGEYKHCLDWAHWFQQQIVAVFNFTANVLFTYKDMFTLEGMLMCVCGETKIQEPHQPMLLNAAAA